jgi:NAD(P)H dehydrogenase (quinone)
MNILLVIANPSKNSFSYQMMEAFIKNHADDTIEILDLYNDKPQNFDSLDFREYHQTKITWANQIVFFAPIWWANFPAILKNWLDINFSTGFAFQYTNKKLVKLLKGKTAKIFVSCDAPGIIYWLACLPLVWKYLVFGYVGIDLVKTQIYGNKRNQSLVNIQKYLANLK